MRILLAEDDDTIARFIAEGLRREGHVVDHLADGSEALVALLQGSHDLAVLDRMLPGLDGIAIARGLRAVGRGIPILMLTALGAVEDKIEGLVAGADDYLVKPFAFGELSARISALTRRPPLAEVPTILRAGDLVMDLLARRVTRAGRPIDLMPREFALLECLIRRKGRVQTRIMLLEAVWDLHFDPDTNVVEAHISRLRAKVDRPFPRELIETVRGAGYRIAE